MIKFRGKDLVIESENEEELLFYYDGKEYKVDKRPILINPYDMTWGKAQMNTYWVVSNGIVRVYANPNWSATDTDVDGNTDGIITPHNEIVMPKVKDIFSNAELLEEALSYRLQYEDSDRWFKTVLDSLTLYTFIESFWVVNGFDRLQITERFSLRRI